MGVQTYYSIFIYFFFLGGGWGGVLVIKVFPTGPYGPPSRSIGPQRGGGGIPDYSPLSFSRGTSGPPAPSPTPLNHQSIKQIKSRQSLTKLFATHCASVYTTLVDSKFNGPDITFHKPNRK